MRKLVLAGMALAMIGTTPSAVAGTDEKTYWLGEGEKRDSRVEFKLKEGKVRDLLTLTGPTRCSGGSKVDIGRGWDDFALNGNELKQRIADRNGSKFFIAGHVNGSKASGRMRGKSAWNSEDCDSGILNWEAEQVSKEEWDEAHLPPR